MVRVGRDPSNGVTAIRIAAIAVAARPASVGGVVLLVAAQRRVTPAAPAPGPPRAVPRRSRSGRPPTAPPYANPTVPPPYAGPGRQLPATPQAPTPAAPPTRRLARHGSARCRRRPRPERVTDARPADER